MNGDKRHGIPLFGHFYLFASITFAFSIGSLFAERHYYLDLMSNFKLHYFWASLFFAVFYFYFDKRWLACVFLLLTLGNAYFLLPWYFQAKTNNKSSTKLIKIMHVNLLSSNQQYQRLKNVIEDQKPDILVLQEVNQRWAKQLTHLQKNYSHSKIMPQEDNFGIAIYSRIPQSSVSVNNWGLSELPSLKLSFSIEQSSFQVYATHPLPPINARYRDLRNQQLSAMLEDVNLSSEPVIIVGDLNVSMWSAFYSEFSNSGLINARQGFGLHNTWPAGLNILGIPIDHIIISPKLNVKSFTTGPNIGSDHLPIIAEIYL